MLQIQRVDTYKELRDRVKSIEQQTSIRPKVKVAAIDGEAYMLMTDGTMEHPRAYWHIPPETLDEQSRKRDIPIINGNAVQEEKTLIEAIRTQETERRAQEQLDSIDEFLSGLKK